MAKHDTQLLKGILSMLLIRMLSTSEDYGYSVVVRLQESGFEGLTEGTVYPALTRLEAKGWLQSRLVPSDSGPARKYYRSTEAGDTELARATADWSDVVVNVERVMQASDVDLADTNDHRR
jgi:PadR family transcriptional regulator PadR